MAFLFLHEAGCNCVPFTFILHNLWYNLWHNLYSQSPIEHHPFTVHFALNRVKVFVEWLEMNAGAAKLINWFRYRNIW